MSGAEDGTASRSEPSVAEEHEEYTSLKRSLSRISNAHVEHHASIPVRDGRTFKPAHVRLPTIAAAKDFALEALRHLPTPILVLGPSKSIILANEAMGRLLGLHRSGAGSKQSLTDGLKGQTLSQIGIDILQDGLPVWVSWEKFLDNLASGIDKPQHRNGPPGLNTIRSGATTPTSHGDFEQLRHSPSTSGPSPKLEEDTDDIAHDRVVDVMVSGHHDSHNSNSGIDGHDRPHKPRSPLHMHAQLIISFWRGHDKEQYYTLSFTAPHPYSKVHVHHSHSGARSVGSNSSSNSIPSSTPASSPSSSSHLLAVATSAETAATGVPLLPNGAPSRVWKPESFTEFQKMIKMKDAMLNSMDVPHVAMWKDESAVFPNRAAVRLLDVTAEPCSEQSYDFSSRFRAYTVDFERELDESEKPLNKLCKSGKEFTNWKIGLIDSKTGKKRNFDVSGHPVYENGELVLGLVSFKDVTEYTEMLATQNEENEQQFQLICDTMPQMIWTVRPDGHHDYFSQRWYDYTGLTKEESMGMGWQLPFHPDDMPATIKRWQHSLATGDEYLTEYRCQRADGAWRWMLGRALPLKDKSGKIVKWMGTCTDIQETLDGREASRQTREQLLSVLEHSKMTLWMIDREAKLTFYEGKNPDTVASDFAEQVRGKSLWDFLANHLGEEDFRKLKTSAERIFSGSSELEVIEIVENRKHRTWHRTTLMPQGRCRDADGNLNESRVQALVGISADVTELKKKEEENIRLLANETAAQEANKMKSRFLANMSHEIRTPINGVLGMAELMMDTKLDEEQSEFAQNIQRSANSLLTVINDILDFSKIESGRLAIEEVLFSLSTLLQDVGKMLAFAAERKGLEFLNDIDLGETRDLIVLGDPGRVRQILINLLTNSIKFTTNGRVKMSARVLSESLETTTISFAVADTGIGIEEEVMKRLFKPFSQADSSTARRFGGTGLGLTISKNLVDLMHGQISLESNLGSGTVASFSIPFSKPQYAETPHPLVDLSTFPALQSELSLSHPSSSRDGHRRSGVSPSRQFPMEDSISSVQAERNSINIPTQPVVSHPIAVPASVPQQHHILIVEDNAINQQIALRTVTNMGFSADGVWNGQEALDYVLKATRTSPETTNFRLPSLILMDVQMPILDGFCATHMLRHHPPYKSLDLIQRIPIVAMTASAIQGDREKCERAGMDDFLAKPVQRKTLEKMIHKWISGESKIRHRRPAHVENGSEADRTALSRPCTINTENSSDCPGLEYMVHNTANGVDSPTRRRLSLAPSNLLPVPENRLVAEAERGLRRAEAEEKAASLRDAKLMAATEEGQQGAIPRRRSSSGVDSATAPRSPPHEAFPNRIAPSKGVLALTEENIGKLNADLAGTGAAPETPDMSSEVEPLDSTLSVLPRIERHTQVPSTISQEPINSVLMAPAMSLPDPPSNPIADAPPAQMPQSRPGQLSASARKGSDWSTSTAKP